MHTNQVAGLVVGLLTAFACNCAVASEESDFGFSVGAEYSSGKYGSSNTTQILTLPVGVQYKINEGLVTLTLPWISMTGFGDVTANGMRFKSPTSTKLKGSDNLRALFLA